MREDSERELWNPPAQGRDPTLVAREAADGIGESWDRVWKRPVPFYKEKYQTAGLGPGEVPPLDEIPRTSKEELRANEDESPPFGTYRSVGLEDAVRVGTSTGTSGRPMIFFYSPHDLEVHVEVARRGVWRYGLRRGARWTHSWPQGIYPTGVSAGRQFLDLGVLEIPVGPPFTRDVAAEHLRLWEILRPTGFMVTGPQLRTYEDVADEIGVDFTSMLDGSTIALLEAACQFDGPRRRLEDAYGFRLHNIGGASEIPGFATSDCRFHTGLHCSPDHFVIQVCDPASGVEVAAGERGNLVITAFGIDATFIRYDLEDVALQSAGPCPCGETGPRYTLLGRRAEAITVAGRTLLPIDVHLALDGASGRGTSVPEFQLVRDSDQRSVHVRVETEGKGGEIADALSTTLEVPVDVEGVPPGSLPRAVFKPRRVS
jgi:phenylacetate-CoA ligase